ncbi:MAG TPA: AAA domain-containing protein [Candidatus Sulfotelmatobacter sp.]|nr:AAA domain-containing protein [Candidatus Sulfotelmatobacter sp.]
MRSARKRAATPTTSQLTGNFQLNLVLLHVLEDQFKLKLQLEELLADFAGDEDDGTVLDIKGLCGKIQGFMADASGFDIELRVILGNFAFQKMAMVKDLRERASDLPAHDVIAAIAGDSKSKTAINAEQNDPDPREFDLIPPDNEFLVLDADSSQQRAIAAVLADQSRMIHGPPGTGKSQTITNLIASLAAAGRRVLFVAEKKAALEVVKHRLDEVGLGHFAIDLHGADISPKQGESNAAGRAHSRGCAFFGPRELPTSACATRRPAIPAKLARSSNALPARTYQEECL